MAAAYIQYSGARSPQRSGCSARAHVKAEEEKKINDVLMKSDLREAESGTGR